LGIFLYFKKALNANYAVLTIFKKVLPFKFPIPPKLFVIYPFFFYKNTRLRFLALKIVLNNRKSELSEVKFYWFCKSIQTKDLFQMGLDFQSTYRLIYKRSFVYLAGKFPLII